MGTWGSNWLREFNSWQSECQEEWTLVSPSKCRARLGMEAMKVPPVKSSMRSSYPTQQVKKLRFATSLNYDACKGYRYRASSQEILTVSSDAGRVLDLQEMVTASPPLASSLPVAIPASPTIQLGVFHQHDDLQGFWKLEGIRA